MSLSKEKRNKVIHYLLEKIADEDKDYIKKTSESFGISLNTIYRYLDQLCQKNIIAKTKKRFKYSLVEMKFDMTLNMADKLEEDIVYRDYIYKLIRNFPLNVRKIWEYSFSEMLNNAIDHSEADKIHISVKQNYLWTVIEIKDNGVGIFEKIRKHFNYHNLEDAITELFKGKLTTDPERHSGEGIFFTSRILDSFVVWSDNKLFTHINDKDELLDVAEFEAIASGTSIYMGLSNFSKKELREVFDEFASEEGGFNVTSIPIKNVFNNAHPVSRSQARRLYNRLDNFVEVTLDFEGVESIGQGFAHELFVVFAKAHPDIDLIVKNDNEEVKNMINHVLTTK